MWLSRLRAAGRRPATLKHYQWCAEQYLTWWSGAAIAATRSDAVAYSAYLTARYRPASAASILRSGRAMYSWLERQEIVEENPFRRLVVKVPEDATEPIPTSDEIDQMIRSAGKDRRAVALLALLAATGRYVRTTAPG